MPGKQLTIPDILSKHPIQQNYGTAETDVTSYFDSILETRLSSN